MRTDLFDFELPPERIALRPASPRDARGCWWCSPSAARPGAGGVQSEPRLEDRIVRDLPDLLRAGDVLVVNDTKVIPARLNGRRIGRGEAEPEIEATLHKRIDGSRWRAFVAARARRLQVGRHVRFGDEGRVCFLGQLDANVEHKGEGGEVTLSFSFHGAVLDQAIDGARRHAVAALHRLQARRRTSRTATDYQTMFAQRRRLGRGADRRAAFHPGAGRARLARAASPAQRHPACRAPAPSCR